MGLRSDFAAVVIPSVTIPCHEKGSGGGDETPSPETSLDDEELAAKKPPTRHSCPNLGRAF
jgi:hypothetical protein